MEQAVIERKLSGGLSASAMGRIRAMGSPHLSRVQSYASYGNRATSIQPPAESIPLDSPENKRQPSKVSFAVQDDDNDE